MATDLEFREAVAVAQKLSSLISDTVIGEYLTDQQHKDYERCKAVINAFVAPPSVQDRVPVFQKALEQGASARSFTINGLTGERFVVSIAKLAKNEGYRFGVLVDSDVFDTEEECLEAAVTYLKEL